MRVLDYAWSTFSGISGADHSRVRLILSETSQRPTLGMEGEGYVVDLPVPRWEKEGIMSVQGLFADADDQGWSVLWRLFRASLYHAAFHVAHGNLPAYSKWAKDKEEYPAIYAISLLEDYRVTLAARVHWPGTMEDLAYANYVGALRISDLDDIDSRGLRTAAKLLLSLWGVSPGQDGRIEENRAVLALAEKVRGMVENSLDDPASLMLPKAAELVYRAFKKTVLPQIPAFPHTEGHSGDSLFEDHLVVRGGTEASRLSGAMGALGVVATGGVEASAQEEFKDAMRAMLDTYAQRQKIRDYYAKLMANTRLSRVTFPRGDYSTFLRTRAELAGPIRNIKNQLLAVKNVLDENQGKGSGRMDMPTAMQVVASGVRRKDVFVRDEPVLKDEAWAILIDASKSVASSSVQIGGIATCLAEVAGTLMKDRSRWGLFGFNDALQLVKDFDEEYDTEVKARIGGLTQQGATLLPDALAAAARSLNARPVESKLLVVVSDCRPTGYAGIEEELVEKVDEATKKGIMLVGIGVESAEVKKYFKVNSFLSSPYQIMKFFVRSYMELSGVA